MSADLQRLNICFYFGKTFATLFSFWCQSMLGIKCLVEETSSVTSIAAFNPAVVSVLESSFFYYSFSKACLTRFCRWFDATIILWDCTSVPVNVANLLTLLMESYFLLFYAVHFLLLTAENLAVRMDSGTFYRIKRWEVRVFGGDDGKSSNYVIDGSDTG